MVILALGIVIGIFLCLIAIVFGSKKENQIERVINKLGKVIESPQRAEFFAPMEPEAEAIADVIQENDKRDRDTPINEL